MGGWTCIIGSALGDFVENADREIVIAREFNAPRELVWEAWTHPEHVAHWWGPRGFTTTIEKMDVRPGGLWKHVMHGPDGANYPNQSVFKEVVKPERIVFSHGGGREGGPGAHFVSTWTFDEIEKDKTRVTIRMVFTSAAARDFVVKEFGAIEGGKQTLERLAEHLLQMEAVLK
ncbi:MAG: SRPBCC family protein [Verrucomicrobiota bacterium]